MSNDKDFKVKNGIQPTVYHEGLGTVVSGQAGDNLAGASYDSVSFSTSVAERSRGLTFSPDGTKLYNCADDESIYQYDLTTPFDLSTAADNGISFDTSSQAGAPWDISFNSNGTKAVVVSNSASVQVLYQYSLSTAYNISTASYDSVSFDTSSQDISPTGGRFNNDGTKFFLMGHGTQAVYEYSLSTAFDLSTISYSGTSFDASGQVSFLPSIFFNTGGTKMYLGDGSSSIIYQYDLSTPYSLSTAQYSSVSFNVSSQESSPYGLVFSSDGTKMYIGGNATSIYQYSTALNTATLDLSTGSVFDYTPTSDIQVTLSNPADSGTVSGATLLLEGAEATGVASTFSTTLYTGNSGTQTITNGIDLAGDGGMVWGKVRSISDNHWIVDSENGIGSNGTYNYLQTNLTTGLSNFGDRSVSSFNSDGFTLANSTNDQFNLSPETYVSWTFKKQAKFFDIVTWTGNGTHPRTFNHSLNCSIGFMATKETNASGNWTSFHRGLANGFGTGRVYLNATNSVQNESLEFLTSNNSSFTLTSDTGLNSNGVNYVAYLFAHDTDASSLIKCGSYTGTSATNHAITLGWEPQWLLIRRADAVEDWLMFDVVRGMGSSNTARLVPNTSSAEDLPSAIVVPTATGFNLISSHESVNSSSGSYIYMAIRAESIPTITYDPTLEWPGGTAPTAPAKGETDVVTFNTRDGGSTYQGVLAIDGAK